MRVIFNTSQRDTLADLFQAADRLRTFQRQVSTGKRLHRPSDDPSAMATTIQERSALAAVDQYTATADSARSRLTVVDTVLSDVVSQLSAAQVALLAGRGSTRTAAEREAAAQQLEALRDNLLRDLNTSYRGTFVFGGAAATVQPYSKDGSGVVSAYQGSTVEVSVDVNRQHAVAVAFDGDALAKGADPDDVFVVMANAIAAVRAGDEAAISNAVTALESAFARATTLQSRVGTALAAIDDQRLQLSESARASEARVSALEDANMAAAISSMAEAETTYRAALGAAAQLNRLSLMDYLT